MTVIHRVKKENPEMIFAENVSVSEGGFEGVTSERSLFRFMIIEINQNYYYFNCCGVVSPDFKFGPTFEIITNDARILA